MCRSSQKQSRLLRILMFTDLNVSLLYETIVFFFNIDHSIYFIHLKIRSIDEVFSIFSVLFKNLSLCLNISFSHFRQITQLDVRILDIEKK